MYSKKLFHNRKRLHSSWVYNQEDINKVLYNVPLITIKDYIPLREGKNGDYMGRCPFCKPLTKNDRHFRVSVKRNLYKCFECGIGGTNIFSFLMIYYKKPFDEVFRYIIKNYTDFKIYPNRGSNWSLKKMACKDDDLPF